MAGFGFKTDRLHVCPWADDLSDPARRTALVRDLDDLLTDDVVRPLPPALRRGAGPDAIEAWIDARDAESEVSTIRSRESASLLGLLIAVVIDEPHGPVCHIGYLFDIAAWGQGYATEMLHGLVAAAAADNLPLCGGVNTDNPASAHVLRKVGFVHSPDKSTTDVDVFVTTPTAS